MKNVLYIGPYNLSSGWGEASRRYLKVLSKCNINLCCQPIYMSSGTTRTDFSRFEQNKSEQYDIIIQNILPHYFTRFEGSKNIIIADFETNHIEHTDWLEHLQLADEVWVDTLKEKQSLIDSGLYYNKIKTINMPVDTSEYNIPLHSKLQELNGKFIFYFIGEYTERKNIPAMLTAFHREFHYSENVVLVIKTSLGNTDPNKLTEIIVDELGSLKSYFRLYPSSCEDLYKSELVITERFSLNELYALHAIGNCFIMPSRGESSCLPLLDAMYFDSHCIVTGNTGMETTLGPFNKYVVKSHETPVVCKRPPLSNIYTIRETWQEIDVLDLQKKMRAAYEDFPASGGKEYIEKYLSVDALVNSYNTLLGVN